MTSQIVASFTPGIIELIIPFLVFVIGFILPLAIIIYIIRLLLRNKKENLRLRLEVAKLADELEHIRKGKDPQTPAATSSG